jgi:hypothetical protein
MAEIGQPIVLSDLTFCLSFGLYYVLTVLRIRDVYPESWFYPSRISDPRSKNSKKEKGEKNVLCLFCGHKCHKIENYFSLEMLKKKFGPIFKDTRTFYRKNCHKALKNMGLGSEIRDPKKPIPDPGSRGEKAPYPGSGSATLLG